MVYAIICHVKVLFPNIQATLESNVKVFLILNSSHCRHAWLLKLDNFLFGIQTIENQLELQVY